MGSCQITKNLINLGLIEIIQFCLKIYDLWRHPHLWVGGWVGQRVGPITKNQITYEFASWWMGGSIGGIMANH